MKKLFLLGVFITLGSACGITLSDPTPRPTSTLPAPTLAPSPTPTPNIPTPVGVPPFITACNISASHNDDCIHSNPFDPTGRGRNAVLQAMNEVFALYPEFFIHKGTPACPWAVKKIYLGAYYWNVQLRIQENSQGDVCTLWDDDQLHVKFVNNFSESYHPLRSDGDFPPSQCISDKDGIFTYACSPADF